MEGNVNLYPFWSPQSSGEAENFARPENLTGIQVGAIIKDSQKLRVPEEVDYNRNYQETWQFIPTLVPPPQAPAQVPDPFTQARSLLDYARTTVGTSQLGVVDSRGNEGQVGKAGK